MPVRADQGQARRKPTHIAIRSTLRGRARGLHLGPPVGRDAPALTVIERNFDDVVVLDIIGRMTVETGAHDLPGHVRRCVEQGHRGVALNLRDVSYCDTSGVAALLRCSTLAEASERRLALVDVQPRVEEILRQMGLLREFHTFTEETVALAQLRR